MSTHSEKVWVIVLRKPLLHTVTRFKSHSIGQLKSAMTWTKLRRLGYRCVRATLTWEEPDE